MADKKINTSFYLKIQIFLIMNYSCMDCYCAIAKNRVSKEMNTWETNHKAIILVNNKIY